MPRIDRMIERYGAGRVVLLGDSCDEWSATDESFMDELCFFADWVEDARGAGVQVDLLLGNHDFQYLLGDEGPGTRVSLMKEVKEALLEMEPAIAATVDGFLLTHGGLTGDWVDEFLDGPIDAEQAKDQLNTLYESGDPFDWINLSMCGPGRGGWEIPGPLWTDRFELLEDPAIGFGQIVGHTPVGTCEFWPSALDPEGRSSDGESGGQWFCDTFSLTARLWPIGDGSMLLVENGEVRVVGGEGDRDIEPWADVVARRAQTDW